MLFEYRWGTHHFTESVTEFRMFEYANNFVVIVVYGLKKKIIEIECLTELMNRCREIAEDR